MPRFGAAPSTEKDGETLELQEARIKQHYTSGMRMMMDGRKEDARNCFQRTLRDVAFERDIIGNARFSALRKARGLCFKMLSLLAEEQGDKDTALRRLGDALALDDSDVVMWHGLGCLALDVGRLNVARCAFERGIVLRPHHPLFLDKLCEATYAIGDFDACRSTVDQLLTLAPAHPRGMVYKGLLLCQHPTSEEEGSELLDDAQEAEGAVSLEEVERLRNLERKRLRRESAPGVPPRSIVLAEPKWRCLLENMVQVLSSTPEESDEPVPADNPATHININQLVVLTVAKQPTTNAAPAVEGAKVGKQVGGQEEMTAHLDEIHDDTTHDSVIPGGKGEDGMEEDEQEEDAVHYKDNDALCMVCGGDVDPGDYPGDALLFCENYEKCGQSYHTTCLFPPLKEPPGVDEQWFCFKCDPRPQNVRLGPDPDAAPHTLLGLAIIPESSNLTGGAGGEEECLTPSKRVGGKSSRKSNLSVATAPSRKSRRQSAADADKRPPEAVQLGRFLDLVAVAGGDDVAEEEEVDTPRPRVTLVAKDGQGKGETLSRYEMIARIGDAERVNEDVVAHLLHDVSLKPLCLLEILHKLVHTLASTACEARVRGKVIDMALELDTAARQHLTYSPEASLFFAEVNLDRYEAHLKDSARQLAQQEGEKDDENPSQDAGSGEEDEPQREQPKKKANRHQQYLAAYNFHINTLWCERFGSWRQQARYWWLLARHALCSKEPWNVLEPLERCKAAFEAGHADAPAAAAAGGNSQTSAL